MEKGYKVLDVKFDYNGQTMSIHPVIIFDEKEMAMVDCGYEGFMPLIEKEMVRIGLEPGRLTKIILTHQDDDHMGGAAEFIQKYPNIEIVASEIESPYISGEKKNLRLQQAEDMQDSLPEDQKEMGLFFIDQLKKIKPVNVDIKVGDGDEFDFGNGCKIIETEGHTPGHISVYLPSENVFITGDAAVIEDGELVFANPHFTLDLESATKSFEFLKSMNCKEYICYHGGVYKNK